VTAVSGLLRKARIAIVLDGEDIVGVLTAIDIIDHLARVGANA
jgi:predicted transcriptional regulator